ncbi:hypothetical protein GJQ57_11030 [Ralstonia pickettii]|uniref:Uncharacterized protein n=1 Tax=Ralstonia pickettii TaxID=329 RepID=A0A7X2L9P3_RALPI|nr:hypothetical protein [Ralstonia pickettii]MRS99183.1 hypothetical protein [Ralstonia pickettii]
MFRVGAGVGQVTGRKKTARIAGGFRYLLGALFLLQAPLSFRQRCEMPKVKVKKLGEGHERERGNAGKIVALSWLEPTAPHQSNRLYKPFF